MKRLIKFYPLALIIIFGIRAGYGQDLEKKLQLSLSTGRQQEDFHWDIAGNINGQSPNVLSELKWKNVSGQNYSGALQWNFWRRFSLLGEYNRVNVRSGSVSDMDYAGDNRTQPTYQENFSDNKGSVSAWNAGAGYVIFNNNLFSLIPYIGYGASTQSLYIVDLTGQFPGLNSSYNTRWKGPFIKATSSVKIWRALKLTADVTYNQVTYSAQGDWNLINEFQHPVSYRHAAKGYGINAAARLVYNLTPNIGLSFGYGYYSWQTGNGTDQLYLSSGQVDKTQLNRVARNGYRIVGGVVLGL
ncbi:hypothetical protein [Mucilaginibacter sp. OK098]|uniref:hypothetical protein n=1 Tax=Mucilaginibacter sp. OK098 TaxID=1855297 RepID=UPI000912E665|nr:hypothetical protein [Mucilaginibacter sp. OK098]SHN34398.1 hypothetical protein SAMN05216524_11138 [Mucilaginibacter sp. OK098]